MAQRPRKPLVELAVAVASQVLRWEKLPQDSPEQVAANLNHDAHALAIRVRGANADELKRIADEANSSDADANTLDSGDQAAAKAGAEADEVLGRLPASRSAGAAHPNSLPPIDWDAARRSAELAVFGVRQRTQGDKAQEANDHPVE